jgi:NAD(P)-dependent dehydrogenase (short-subunit alcohol dehydrogenase family)
MSQKLKNKVAVVTGGNSGIGLGTAKLFAQEGAKVVITGRDAETINSALVEIGDGAAGFVSDVRDMSSFAPLFEQVYATQGKIDVLIVNAGIMLTAPVAETTEEIFDKVTDINYKGAFFTVKHALPYMNEGASIVITTSTVSDKAFVEGSVYVASKAAKRALVRVLAAELAARKIRVNALAPGFIDTPFLAKCGYTEDYANSVRGFFEGAVAMKRAGTIAEMAKGFLFLASDDSSYMTGGELLMDGGYRDL